MTVRGLTLINANGAVIVGVGTEAQGAFIDCNRIGLDATGTAAPNKGAIYADNPSPKITNNLIRFNAPEGQPTMQIYAGNMLVQNNIIANNGGTMLVSGSGEISDNLIGSLTNDPLFARGEAGNNGNASTGIVIQNSGSLTVTRNIVVNNNDGGILIKTDGASGTSSDITLSGNLVSANSSHGIKVTGASTDVTIIGNRIGTNAAGGQTSGVPQGNENAGILLDGATVSGVTIGGTAQDDGNTIAYNTGAGVRVLEARGNQIAGNTISANDEGGVIVEGATALGNTITQNSIFGHATLASAKLGIDLGADGRTTNDPDDSDSGPNNLQNFPVFTSATLTGGVFTGNLNVAASGFATGSYTIELFKADTGEGRTYLGRNVSVAHNANSFTVSAISGLLAGDSIVATATDANGNSSEFSEAVTVAVTEPNIAVAVGGSAVVSGQAAPVSFGTATVGTASALKTFTVTNNGQAPLNLGTVTVNPAAGFTVVTQPSATVAAGASTSFQIRLNTANVGSFSSTVSFTTNVTGQSPFSFPVSGTVTTQPTQKFTLYLPLVVRSNTP